MRPKIVIGVMVIVVLAIGLVRISRTLRSQPSGPSADLHSAISSPPLSTKPTISLTPTTAINGSGTNPPAAPDPAHAQHVQQRIMELNILAMKSDRASRDAILGELQNPDKEIRKGALEAAIQFGDRSVVPRLKEVAAETQDPAEKAEILAAIDYINLPSLTEYLAAQRAQSSSNAPTSGRRERVRSPSPQPAASTP
jgi:hypothetical protein